MSSMPRRQFLLTAALAPATIAKPSEAQGTVPTAYANFSPSPQAVRFMQLAAEEHALHARYRDEDEVPEEVLAAFWSKFESTAQSIISRQPTCWADIVEKALVAANAQGGGSDGSWNDLWSEHTLFEKATAECALAILMLAGLTDGKRERGRARKS